MAAHESPKRGRLQLRIPNDVLARADRLVPGLQHECELRVLGRITRSSVWRLALALGLPRLEDDDGGTHDA